MSDSTGSALSDGTYSNISITVTDAAGNSSSESDNTGFKIDTTAPTIQNESWDSHKYQGNYINTLWSTYKKLTYGDGIVFKFETTEKLQSITITASITIGVGDSNDFTYTYNSGDPNFYSTKGTTANSRVGLKMKYYPIFLAPVRTELMDLLEIYLLLS